MIKLWVDDIRKAPDGWHWAKTATEAIRILATQVVTEISIDHDISHKVAVGNVSRPYPCPETFESVAWFVRQLLFGPSTQLTRITIHTANGPAGDRMMKIFQGFGTTSQHRITVRRVHSDPCNRLESEEADG